MFTYAQLVATGGVEAKEESADDWPQIDPPMDQWPPLVQQDKKCLAMRAFTSRHNNAEARRVMLRWTNCMLLPASEVSRQLDATQQCWTTCGVNRTKHLRSGGALSLDFSRYFRPPESTDSSTRHNNAGRLAGVDRTKHLRSGVCLDDGSDD
ncbi:uncharacterized protein LOC128093278 [Culex pipiens pallens]|uniref:uncharacterized protein LOC128093278 n=1 Tax=Culex pipiens pallens TaxID=42434 RepID=UPI0022AA4AB1|nr:uncharacterized protein LOC128093278 [Culex pipiens pallens]